MWAATWKSSNKGLPAGEVLLLNYQGEASDFVRLNHNKIRQAGHVYQQTLHLNLINNRRETGMTRFACLWVEHGQAVAPVNVMRFDECLYHILGDHLEGLTRECEHILDSSSYEWRSDASACLPGALVNDFTFTL